MVVSQTRGTPNNHLFFDGIFHEKNHPFLGVPPWTPQVLPVFLRCFLRFTPEISVSPSHGCFNIRRTADSAMAPWRSLGPWDLGIVRMANCETKQKKLGMFLGNIKFFDSEDSWILDRNHVNPLPVLWNTPKQYHGLVGDENHLPETIYILRAWWKMVLLSVG